MNMNQIRYFIAVASCLSFSKAADQLYLTQPALSRHIVNMENELGLQLFIRTGREVRLTPAGSVLYLGFSQMYDNYTENVQKAQNVQQGLDGSLSIGVLDETNIADFMPPIYAYFKEKHPNVALNFHPGSFQSLITGAYNGKLDLIFTLHFNVINREFLLFQEVSHSVDNIVLNKFHPLANKQRLSLKDVKDEMFVFISPDDNAESSPLILEACKKEGFIPNHRFASSLAEQILWIEAGVGVTILDSRTSLKMNPHIKFVEMESDWDPSLVVAWNRGNYNPAIPIFLKKLNEVLLEINGPAASEAQHN